MGGDKGWRRDRRRDVAVIDHTSSFRRWIWVFFFNFYCKEGLLLLSLSLSLLMAVMGGG